ncbi:MAG: RraA family protein, partial [Geminicoccaceae bacterium]
MIGDPPVLTLRQSFERPSAAQVAAFAGVPTGFAVDAMMGQGAIDHRVKPLWPDSAFAAPAVTARCGPRDNMAVWVAMKVARPGDVLALATGGYEDAAVIGDHVAAIAKSLGIVAVVTDGLVRDIDGLEQVGLPVFCRGLTPNSPYKHGPCEVGTRISLGGVAIDPGDLLIGDRDGVVVVARSRLDEVIAGLEDVRRKERETGERIAAGATIPAWVDELIGSSRTR